MIQFENVSKNFGEKQIFENLSFTINKGSMVGVVGPSGCGKTTILNLIGGLEKQDSGVIVVNGIQNPNKKAAVRNYLFKHELAYLFQNYALVENESIEYNLSMALHFVKSKDKMSLMKKALMKVNIDIDISTPIFVLSGGEQQRVALARLFLKPSSIILADEPTGNLDKNNGIDVMNILKSFTNEGKTIVVVTHNEEYFDYFDQVIMLQ